MVVHAPRVSPFANPEDIMKVKFFFGREAGILRNNKIIMLKYKIYEFLFRTFKR